MINILDILLDELNRKGHDFSKMHLSNPDIDHYLFCKCSTICKMYSTQLWQIKYLPGILCLGVRNTSIRIDLTEPSDIVEVIIKHIEEAYSEVPMIIRGQYGISKNY